MLIITKSTTTTIIILTNDRHGNTCRQKCCAKGSGKEVKIQEFNIKPKRTRIYV